MYCSLRSSTGELVDYMSGNSYSYGDKMEILEFIKGKKPDCVAPRYKHTWVNKSGEKTYCLWCNYGKD